MKKKILVTGDGFVPSELVEALKEEYEVSWINSETEKNVNGIAELKIEGVDTVIHLSESKFDKEDVMARWNIFATASALSWAETNKVKNFIYVSTTEIYGNKTDFPTHEGFRPDHLNMYAASKFCGEVFCELWHKQTGMNILILRPGELYGDNEDQSVVGQFYKAKQMGLKAGIPLGTEATRDLVHVKDFVTVVKHYLRSNYDFLVTNVGTGKSVALSDVANAIGCEVDYKKIKNARVREELGVQELIAAGIVPQVKVLDWIKAKQEEEEDKNA